MMDSLETQDVDGSAFHCEDDETEESSPWGRVFPLASSFTAFDLVKEKYVFGRGDECDYQFTPEKLKAAKNNCFQALSKKHFQIVKEGTSTGEYTFLVDSSSNGTFINGDKVGKGNKQVLNNNDEISLAMKKNKAFVFIDLNAKEENYPDELKNKYTISRTLGKGACGEVKLAFAKGSCKRFAVKIVNKKKFTVRGINEVNLGNSVMSEVKILKQLKHPCIIGIEDVIDTPDALFIVLELVEGGELFDRIANNGHFEEPVAKLFFYQLVCAIKYLHDQGITHRDLKPENILLSSDAEESIVKVTDFGLSKFVDAGTMMKTFCGTPNYLAPEVLLTAGSGSYSHKIDNWSLGVILFICVSGYPPFTEERKDMDLAKQIMGGHYDFPPELGWSKVNPQAIDLIKKLLVVDPRKRVSLGDALAHPWLADEEVKTRANKLLYPEAEAMKPPQIPNKRKSRGETEEPAAKKLSSGDASSS